MKKVIKLFLFAFVLFGFGFVKANAAETIKVNFKNVNPLDESVTKPYSGFSSKGVKYTDLFGSAKTFTSAEGEKVFYFADDEYNYDFNGFKTADGTKIDGTYSYGTPNLTVTDTNTGVLSTSKIQLVFAATAGVDGESEIDIYVDWVKTKKPTLTIRLWDVKDGQTKYVVKTEEKLIDRNSSGTSTRSLDQIFTAMSERPYTGINKNQIVETDKKGLNTYTFTGWFADADCTEEITSTYTPSGETAKVLNTLKTSGTSIKFGENNKMTQDATVNIYGHFDTKTAPQLYFNYTDNVGNGTGSWHNVEAAKQYKHTFATPADVPSNYKFLYWKIDETIYNAGQSFNYDFTNKPDGNVDTFDAFAWYQPGVKVTYYNEDKTVYKEGEWSFEDVQMISEEPSKLGYEFAGWVDGDGNPVSEDDDIFKKPDITIEPGKEKEVKLYATFNRIMVDVKLNKIWVDFKTDYRKSVTFEVYKDNGETLVGTYTLTEEDLVEGSSNIWSTSVSLPRFEEDGTLIEYTVKEVSVEYYTSESESNEDNDEITVTNTINNSTVVVNHVDEDDGTVLATETIEKPIGSDYETSSTTIEDYEYTEKVDGEANGFVTPEEQTVTYYYRALIGTVTVYYVDIDTGDVLTTETLSGKYKAAWEADLTKTFDGYEYVDADGETSGIFGADEIEVTLFYTKNTGDEGEKEDEKEIDDNIITPPHTDSDVVFVEQQLYLDDRKYRK